MLKARVLAVVAATTLAGAIAVGPAIPAQAATVVKATQSLQFKPQTLRVHKGTKVVWKNTCTCTHTVTATSNNWSKNTTLSSGSTTSFTFKHTGTFKGPLKTAQGVVQPTGKKFEVEFCTVAHWKDGKIVEEKLFYDLMGVLKQIGAT